MSAELTVREPGRASLPEKMNYAKAMASSNLLPRQYQGNPANLLFALEYADALGVSPINAITSIHVIEGKPTASADLIAGLVRRAGHKLRVTGDDTQATAQIVRADDPEHTFEAVWTMEKARAANLTGKGVWRSYPAAMLRSRAITEVARMGASDALYGVIYSPEELGAEVDSEGDVTATVTAGLPVPEPTPQPAPEPQAPADDNPSEKQMGLMFALLGEAGLKEKAPALRYVGSVIDREIESRSDLTASEVSRVVDALQAESQQAPADLSDAPEVDEAEWPPVQEAPDA